MNDLPKEPVIGQPLSVTWGRNITRYLRKITPIAGSGMRISRTANGTVLSAGVSSEGGTSGDTTVKPLTVRWMPKSDTDTAKGEWQVYIPRGSVACTNYGLTSSYIPEMSEGVDKNNKKQGFWYKIETPKSSDAFPYRRDDFNGLAWSVVLALKPYPRLKVTTDPDSYAGKWKTYNLATIIQYSVPAGDGQKTIHAVVQNKDGVIAETRDTDTAFSIVWKTTGDETSPTAAFKPYVTNQTMIFGRLDVTNSTDTAIENWNEVYLKIAHSDESFAMSLQQTSEDSNDDKTVVHLYTMKDGFISLDRRTNLDKLSFWNN